MRLLTLLVVVAGLNSCNTFIGIGRDAKHAWNWTADKIHGSGESRGYDAPVY